MIIPGRRVASSSRESVLRQLSTSKIINDYIRAANQILANFVVVGIAQIKAGRSVSQIGVVKNPVVLKIVVVIDRKDISSLFGESATYHRPGNRMSEA